VKILEIAEEQGITKDDLLEYQLYLKTDETTEGILNHLTEDIDINKDEQLIYITCELY
jgi:hypothetical protein